MAKLGDALSLFQFYNVPILRLWADLMRAPVNICPPDSYSYLHSMPMTVHTEQLPCKSPAKNRCLYVNESAERYLASIQTLEVWLNA